MSVNPYMNTPANPRTRYEMAIMYIGDHNLKGRAEAALALGQQYSSWMLQRGAETSPLPSLSAPITKASRACRTPPLASYTSFTRFCSVCQTLKSMQRGKRRSERSRAEYAAGHSPATVRPGGTLSLAANRVGQHMYW